MPVLRLSSQTALWLKCSLCSKHMALNNYILKWWPSMKQLDLFGVLFNCSRFCHPPLTVLSDFQELLCLVLVLEEELCYAAFSAGSRFALVGWLHCVGNRCHPALRDKGPSQFSHQFLCCIVQMWAYFLLVWWLNCILASLCELKTGDPDVWRVYIDFAEAIGFMAWSTTGSNKSSLQSSCLKGTYAFHYLYFDLDW